jgi:hypothetical protein
MNDTIYQILSWSTFVIGLIAAGFWWKAAGVVIKKGDPRAEDDFFIGEVAVRSTLRVQTRYMLRAPPLFRYCSLLLFQLKESSPNSEFRE